MCGINGIFQIKSRFEKEVLYSLCHGMNEKIIHRGPDSEGLFSDEFCAIGMRRLSIIDLKTGDQPIWNEDGSKGIVFNGEIYNYRKLRNELIEKGCTFQTHSDTEVILKGIERHGIDFINSIDGMFAFAIYDKNNHSIFIARDRAGEKPLYYTIQDGILIFASELKSILSTGLVKKSINKSALSQYLQLTYIPAPLTIFENIFKLQPGHYLYCDCNGNMDDIQYWDLKYCKDNMIEDYDECKKRLRRALLSSVERCLVSDVPIGAFLSGGIDSGIITGLAAQISDKTIKTFTIGFKDKLFDESERALITAQKYKTDHHVMVVGHNEMLEALNKVIDNLDEPFADPSLVVTYIVAKYAGQYVKTVLTGDAGDELFAGYNRYRIGYYSSIYSKFPNYLKNICKSVIKVMPKDSRLSRKAGKLLRCLDLPLCDQRISLMKLGFDRDIFSSQMNACDDLKMIKRYYEQYMGDVDETNCILYADFKVSLEGDMLTKVDRAAMLASVETRVPLLSKDVIEQVVRIPGEYKMKGLTLKKIFKDAFVDIIPDEIMRASKRGFEVPISSWLQNELKSDVEKVLYECYHTVMFENGYNYINNVIELNRGEYTVHQMEIWTLYILGKWLLANNVSIEA